MGVAGLRSSRGGSPAAGMLSMFGFALRGGRTAGDFMTIAAPVEKVMAIRAPRAELTKVREHCGSRKQILRYVLWRRRC